MILMILLLLPPLAGLLLWLLRKSYPATIFVAVLSAAVNLAAAIQAFRVNFTVTLPVFVHGFDLTFRADATASLFLLLSAAAFLLSAFYTAASSRGKDYGGLQLLYLFMSFGMLNGALLSDHLGLMLFFWEGLLCTQFGALVQTNANKPRAAVKALTLSGTADLILMLGIAAVSHAAETGTISAAEQAAPSGLGAVGCVLMLLGAFGKAGCIPFQTWIPVAAEDASTPFMAAFSGAIGPIAGIYLANVVFTRFFSLNGTGIAVAFAVIGALTMLGGAAMAVSQNNLKRAVSWLVTSQAGYAALTLCVFNDEAVVLPLLAVSVFCCAGMYMTAGAVCESARTSDLQKLGGLSGRMPLTALCFAAFSVSIAVVPIFISLFSGASFSVLPRNMAVIFCVGTIPGVFLTVLSLLRLTRGMFFSKPTAMADKAEKPRAGMIFPMVPAALLSLACVFGTGFLTSFIRTELSVYAEPARAVVPAAAFFAVLVLAALDHLVGCRKDGGAVNACVHVREFPGLRQFCALKECGVLDPYAWLNGLMSVLSRLCRKIEDGVSWVYDRGITGVVFGIGDACSRFNNGSLSRYLFLAVCGMFAVALIFTIVLL